MKLQISSRAEKEADNGAREEEALVAATSPSFAAIVSSIGSPIISLATERELVKERSTRGGEELLMKTTNFGGSWRKGVTRLWQNTNANPVA